MVGALTLQKRYLPLAELEPQLWYDPFPASAYQGMVAAQEEVRGIDCTTAVAVGGPFRRRFVSSYFTDTTPDTIFNLEVVRF